MAAECTKKAVILARGLGTRMRSGGSAVLTGNQKTVAASGVKALVPLPNGKTLLDLITANLRAAGFDDICLVIGPEHRSIRDHCSANKIDVSFAIQNDPDGTADAVLAAEPFAANSLFAVFNSDNLYPVDSLARLREAGGPSLLAFEREALIEKSNITAERIAKFATIEMDADGLLARIVEKPARVDIDSLVSMNAWVFSTAIFDACRAIDRSERGEFELSAAVQHAIDRLGEKFAAIRTQEGVLDLSSRDDIVSVSRFLQG